MKFLASYVETPRDDNLGWHISASMSMKHGRGMELAKGNTVYLGFGLGEVLQASDL